MCVGVCAHVSADDCGILKKVPDPLQTELQEVVSHLAWVLGTQFRFFTRKVHGAKQLASLHPLHRSFSTYSMLLQRTIFYSFHCLY